MQQMPLIDLSKADPELRGRDLEIAQRCLGRDNRLRATKPDPKKDGEAAWVWRMAVLELSPRSQHQCMPVTAEFDLAPWFDHRAAGVDFGSPEATEGRRVAAEARKARKEDLYHIVNAIGSCVPVKDWHGVRRWATKFS